MRRRRDVDAAEKVLDVGRRQRALGQHRVASLFDERRDVVQLVLVGAFLSTPALDVVLDVMETLHRRVDDPAHSQTTHCQTARVFNTYVLVRDVTTSELNKKLRYREEHNASVVLTWCTVWHLSEDNQQINN